MPAAARERGEGGAPCRRADGHDLSLEI